MFVIPRRITAFLVGVAASGLLIAGCGSGTGGSSITAPAAALAGQWFAYGTCRSTDQLVSMNFIPDGTLNYIDNTGSDVVTGHYGVESASTVRLSLNSWGGDATYSVSGGVLTMTNGYLMPSGPCTMTRSESAGTVAPDAASASATGLVGTWRAPSDCQSGDGPISYAFHEDGTVTFTGPDDSGTMQSLDGQYAADSSGDLTLRFSGQNLDVSYEVNGDSLTIKDPHLSSPCIFTRS